MPRRRTLPLVFATIVVASCDAPARSVAPRLAPGARPAADIAVGDAVDPTRALVQRLFSDGKGAGDALAYYDAAKKGAAGGDACTPTAELLALTLDAYRTGQLTAAPGDDKAAANVQQLVVGLNALCGRVAPPSFPLAALSSNGAAVYLPASGGTAETLDGLAGISVPDGALSRGVLLTITRRLVAAPTGKELGTTLESGPFYDISTYPYLGKLGKPVSIGLVQVGPAKTAPNIDVILGHLGLGGTETVDPQECTVPSRLFGRFVAPSYLRPRLALSRAASSLASVAAHNDSSGTAGGCGSANDLSPFGFITLREPGFNARPHLTASYACGTSFAIRNDHSADLVAVWRAFNPGSGQGTLGTPHTVLVRAGRSVTVNLGDVAPDAELRLQYGPVVLGTTALPAVQRACE